MRGAYGIGTATALAVAVASVQWADGSRWHAPTFAFWLVVIAAGLCVLTSLSLAVFALRADQAELGIVSAFFMAVSILPLVHGITIPGVVYGENAATMNAVFLAVPVGAVAAGAVAMAAGAGRPPQLWRRVLMLAFVLTAGLGIAILAAPQTSLHPTPGSASGVVAALASFGVAAWLGVRHVRLAVIAERAAPMVVAMGYLLVAASALVFLGASMWSTYFWIAHAVDIGGVFLATVGALAVYWRHGSVFSVMGPITALDTRAAFSYGLSPVVHRFVADLEAKDPITRDHVIRTSALAIDVADELDLDPVTVRSVGLVGMLHDVGKLAIPDEILTKPGRLTDDEFATMRSHAAAGADMLAATAVLADIAPAVRAHHERIDGGGYPDNLAGDDIPIVARVVSVCDSYDAMAFTRHYREGMDAGVVRGILEEHSGSQWDADIVAALLRVVDADPSRDVGPMPFADVGRTVPSIGCDCIPAHSVSAHG